jgi:hypothetical protein
MIAAGPPNKKGGYSPRLSEYEITNNRLLLEQLRTVKGFDLASWQRRVDNLLAEFIQTGHVKHLAALDRTLAGIGQRVRAL